MNIPFQGRISETHYLSAQAVHLGWRRLLVPIISVLAFLLIGVRQMPYLPVYSILYVAAVFCIIGFIPSIVNPIMHRRYFRKAPLLSAPLTGCVSADAFELSAAHGSTRLEWPQFLKAVIATDIVLLYQQPRLFNILTRDFFASEDEWKAANAIIRDHVKKVVVAGRWAR